MEASPAVAREPGRWPGICRWRVIDSTSQRLRSSPSARGADCGPRTGSKLGDRTEAQGLGGRVRRVLRRQVFPPAGLPADRASRRQGFQPTGSPADRVSAERVSAERVSANRVSDDRVSADRVSDDGVSRPSAIHEALHQAQLLNALAVIHVDPEVKRPALHFDQLLPPGPGVVDHPRLVLELGDA